MAISGGDGSIILTTKVDTSGISKGSISIKNSLQSVDTTVKKIQNSFSAFREQKVTLQTLNQAIKDQQYVLNSLNLEYAEYVARGKASSTEAKQLKSNIDALTVEMKEMESAAATLGSKGSTSINKIGVAMRSLLSYFIGIQTVFKVISSSGEAAQFASQTEAGIKRLVDIYGEASQVVGDFIDQNARAIGMSRAAAASFAATYGNIFSAFAEQSTNAQLTNEFLNLTAVIASKTGRTVEEVQEKIKSGLFGNLRAIDDLGIFVRQSALIMTDAFKKIADGRSWEQLNNYEQQQVIALAILEQGVNKYGNEVMRTTALTRAQYNAAYQDFQNTWGQVVNKVLIPVLKVLTQVFTIATKGLQIIAGLTGKTIDTSTAFSSQEKAIGGAVDNQEALTDAVKGTNKELKKSLAGFDEINILSQDTAESGGAGATGISGGVGGIGDLGGTLDGSSYVEETNTTLMAIMGIVAEAMVAVGLILLFTGHIGWGVGFIIAGAGLLSVTMASASEFGYDGIISMLTTIMGIAGGALLALGIILLWIGGVVGKGVAIGMIIAGASLIVSAVASKAAFSPNDIAGWLSTILGIAAGALLALGIILCMVGSTPLGVGMIIAGSVALVSAVALNFNEVTDKITGWVAVIMAIAGGALLVLGIVLTASGANLALGIALIAVGAIALVTPIALNWNVLAENLKGPIGLITALVGAAVLVLGIILTCTGNFALGIPLLVAGAAALVTPIAINWDAIVDWVKGAWNAVKQFWNTYIAPIFTAQWWADLGKKAINGLLGVIEKGLNWIIDKINEFVGGLSKIVGAVGDVIGVDWSIPKIPKVKIPRLAQGAVIPPNREFLAVLGDQKHGTNIEAPLQTIVDAFNIALQNNGAGQTTKEEHYYLGETELMQIVYKLFKGGERLQGPSLISGGVC